MATHVQDGLKKITLSWSSWLIYVILIVYVNGQIVAIYVEIISRFICLRSSFFVHCSSLIFNRFTPCIHQIPEKLFHVLISKAQIQIKFFTLHQCCAETNVSKFLSPLPKPQPVFTVKLGSEWASWNRAIHTTQLNCITQIFEAINCLQLPLSGLLSCVMHMRVCWYTYTKRHAPGTHGQEGKHRCPRGERSGCTGSAYTYISFIHICCMHVINVLPSTQAFLQSSCTAINYNNRVFNVTYFSLHFQSSIFSENVRIIF